MCFGSGDLCMKLQSWSPIPFSDRSMRHPIVAAPNRFNGTIERVGFAIAAAYIVFFASSFAMGVWLVDAHGQGIQTDFINVWAAGRLVLDGNPAAAYDWIIHKAVEEQGVGHPFENYFGWPYPPIFLFVAAALSVLPYLPAFLTWMALTLPAYLTVIRMIVGHRIGFILACAFPGVLWNISVGQNGFLTAALLGSALAAMEKRPLLAGIFIGLLSYKPQFGILFPLVLAMNGQWRIFSMATLTTLSLIVLSWLAFGLEAWQAFFYDLPLTSALVLSAGLGGFQKLQTIFGVVRWWGGDETLASILQGAMTATCVITVLLIWRQRIAYEIKAAALGVAVLLATPYLYIYDLPALAVPMAFLTRVGLRQGFVAGEIVGLTGASILVLVVPLTGVPYGFLAILVIASLISRRVFAPESPLVVLRASSS